MDKRDQIGRALRRGVALGLVLVACWGLSLMADLSGVKERLAALGQEPGLSVSLLSSQLGELPRQTASAELTGWGRLLLSHSALLAARRGSGSGSPRWGRPDGGFGLKGRIGG